MDNLSVKIYEMAGLKNATEDLLIEALNDIVKDKSLTYCKCWICLGDVSAIALNELQPMYFTNFVDEEKVVEKKANYRNTIKDKVIEAFEKVSKNPHH